jgi:putative chitinase
MTITVTEAQIRAVCPQADAAIVAGFLAGLPEAVERFDITTEARLEHFLAQWAQESMGFCKLEESLYYRTPERIAQVWRSRFPTAASARPYARNPKALACKVYNGRMGNRPGSTDGWDYRGRSLPQITGREMYDWIGNEIGVDLVRHPDRALDPALSALIAGAVWSRKGLNPLADADDIVGITRRINGGTHGLADRRRYRAAFAAAIVAPDDLPAHAGPANAIDLAAYQQRLVALGYFEVGTPDGLPGARTRAAVMAFQADNGLEVTAELDQATRDAMATAAPRPVAPARRNADTEVLRRKGSETIRWTDRLKAWVGRIAGSLGLGGGAIFAGDGASDGPDANGMVEQLGAFARLKGLLDSLGITPTTVILLVAVAAAVWFFAHRIEKNRVAEYREGKNT